MTGIRKTWERSRMLASGLLSIGSLLMLPAVVIWPETAIWPEVLGLAWTMLMLGSAIWFAAELGAWANRKL